MKTKTLQQGTNSLSNSPLVGKGSQGELLLIRENGHLENNQLVV